MDQTAGPTVPAPQASAPAVPRAGQAPGLSSDRVPGARLAHRCGVRRGRARGQRPVRLHAGRAVLRRGDPPSGVRLCGPAAAHAAAYPRRRAAWPQPDRDPDHPGAGRRGGRGRGRPVRRAVRRRPARPGAGHHHHGMHPFLLGADHVDNTTALDLLAWTVVLLGVTTALLRDRPRWWLGTGGHEPEASIGGCAAEVNGCGAAACGDGNDHGSSLPAPVPLG